jgi:hypothetical protein
VKQWFVLAQVANLSQDPTYQWITPLVSLGGFGFLLVLLLLGRVQTKAAYDEMKEDRDAWKAACEISNQSLSSAQASLKQFADAGEVTNRLLTEIKSNTRNKVR